MTTDREMLRQLPLFAGLSEEDFERLYQMAEPVTVAAGEVLIREGDVGDAMYAILEGEFEVSQGSGQQELIVGRRGARDPWERAAAELGALRLPPSRSARLAELHAELARRAADPPRLDPLDR